MKHFRRNNRNNERKEDNIKVNEKITSREVRVVDEKEGMLGVLSLSDALSKARERDLDLVEISPNAEPPVCKIISYKKFIYQKDKKKKENRKTQKNVVVKEIKMRPKTDVHDYNFKIKNSRSFLEKGYKVKFTIQFRGREMAFIENGRRYLDRILEDTKDLAKIDTESKLEGRNLHMTLSPLKVEKAKSKEQENKE